MFTALALAVTVLGLAVGWVKSEHTPAVAIQVAQDFLQKLEARQFAPAFELTVKQGYVGQTVDELREISSREFCKADRLLATFPFQSNGNRLRRLILGREIDPPELHIEFAGVPCLLRVTVRKTADNTWRVFYFGAHAG